MGITVMESFMDSVKIVSAHEEGTRVVMKKTIMGEQNVGQRENE
jgi:anti-sigma regulatory factor (Ser/Thr protein kinase)